MKVAILALVCLLAASKAEVTYADDTVKAPAFIIDDLLETLRGVLVAWEVDHEEVNKLLLCVGGMRDIEKQIVVVMEEIKNIDLKDLVKVVQAIVKIFGAFQQLFKDIEPCIDSGSEIRNLLDKFIHLTPAEMLKKVAMNLLDNGRKVYNDIVAAIGAFGKRDYYGFGYTIGDLIELLFFRTPDP